MKTAFVSAVTALASVGALGAAAGEIIRVEGTVFLDGRPVLPSSHGFPRITGNSVLRTEDGRVELLLAPGATLRLGENGSLRMIANRSSTTQVELLAGPTVVLTDNMAEGTDVKVVCEEEVTLSNSSAYRFENQGLKTEENRCEFKVYKGVAEVQLSSIKFPVKAGHRMDLNRLCGDHTPVWEFDTNDASNPLSDRSR